MLASVMRCLYRAPARFVHYQKLCFNDTIAPTVKRQPKYLEQRDSGYRRWIARAALSDRPHEPFPTGLNDLLPTHCCGCGVKLQQDDDNAQGYFITPKKLREAYDKGEVTKTRVEELRKSTVKARVSAAPPRETVLLDPDTVAGDEYVLDEGWHTEADGSGGGGSAREVPQEPADPLAKLIAITCARCHKLAYEGRVASAAAERELPPFDLGATVGAKIARRVARRAVLLVVVDIADLDGSLPRQALFSLLPETWQQGSRDRLPFELVLAVNKMDVLPRSASHAAVENFARRRMREAGLPSPTQVHLVSCKRNVGVNKLLRDIVDRVGIQGDLWVIGAQNAGKSSLLNALRYRAGTAEATAALTTAPLPGTTLDVVPVEGLPLQARSRCYDTPGVPHPFQLTARFGVEEVKQLLPRDTVLKPRTYRIGANRTVFIGGVARIDVTDFPGGTLYLTVWASDLIPLHMGRTMVRGESVNRPEQPWVDKAGEFWKEHVGAKLNPPLPGSKADVPALGPVEVPVEGTAALRPQTDICIAGLGWVAVGLLGQAKLKVWTPAGIAVTRRAALLPDHAKVFERPGWSANSKALFKKDPSKPDAAAGHRAAEKKARRGPITKKRDKAPSAAWP
eukprot:jgi/Ulvmu1/8510/UM044_0044.1